MVIMWYTAKAAPESKVVFGRDRNALRNSADATDVRLEDGKAVVHTSVLKLLAARETYYYQCGNDDDGWSDVFQFSRKGEELPDTETLTFITYGDMGVHFANSNAVLQAVEKEDLKSLDFVFHAGDLAYAFKNMTRWEVFLNRIQRIGAYVPYLVCLGNRDDVADVEKRYKRRVFFTVHPLMASLIRFLMPFRGTENGVRTQFYSFQRAYVYGIVMAVGGQVPFNEASYQHSWVVKELET